MNRIRRLRNPVMEYAWGSRSAIARLLDEPVPTAKPQAELWMGAHPRAPSLVESDRDTVPLGEWIARDPVSVLGPGVAVAFAAGLPFLLKVLAAARPLSIQAHPDLEQARAGFARENEAGIPLESDRRSYRDSNHKPELICALSPFWALNGFRPPDEMRSLVGALDVEALGKLASAGIEPLLRGLLSLEAPGLRRIVGQAVGRARALATRDPAFDWMDRLHREFPDDPGVLSPLILNLVKLEPGQAMSLPARRLHAYLEGTGMEIMANSDNVLRGGLTVKHVDVEELLRVLSFEPSTPGVMAARRLSDTLRVYETDAREFRLGVIEVAGLAVHTSGEERSVEILLCTQGRGRIDELGTGYWLEVRQGDAFLVPASSGPYSVRGDVILYRASVPGGEPA